MVWFGDCFALSLPWFKILWKVKLGGKGEAVQLGTSEQLRYVRKKKMEAEDKISRLCYCVRGEADWLLVVLLFAKGIPFFYRLDQATLVTYTCVSKVVKYSININIFDV